MAAILPLSQWNATLATPFFYAKSKHGRLPPGEYWPHVVLYSSVEKTTHQTWFYLWLTDACCAVSFSLRCAFPLGQRWWFLLSGDTNQVQACLLFLIANLQAVVQWSIIGYDLIINYYYSLSLSLSDVPACHFGHGLVDWRMERGATHQHLQGKFMTDQL